MSDPILLVFFGVIGLVLLAFAAFVIAIGGTP